MTTETVEPWMHGVLELIEQGCERLETGTDAGKRQALVLFDEAIEQSIKIYASIPDDLRGGRELPPELK